MPGNALLGRASEIAALERAIAERRAVVVVGEAGIGKTSLIHTAATGRRALVGGALGLLSFVPFLAITRATGRPADGEPGLVARDLARRVGNGILALDDLQWADDGTIDVLEQLVGTVPVLAAVRSGGPRSVAVTERLVAAGFTELRIGPLPEAAGMALAQAAGQAIGVAAARALVASTGGNPLLIQELARSGLTSSLRLAIAHRSRHLGSAARELLELLAVARAPLPLPTEVGSNDVVDTLVDAGLAGVADGRVEVRHALIAEAVTAELSAERAREVHREVARRVTDRVEQAHHLAAAGDRAAAVAVARAAAERATPGLRIALLALAAENDDGPDAGHHRLEAGEALFAAGLYGDAERMLGRLPRRGDEIEARALVVQALCRWHLGDAEAAHRDFERADAIVGGSGTAVEANLLTNRAWLSLVERQGVMATGLAERAIDVLRTLGLPMQRALRVRAVGLMLMEADGAEVIAGYEQALSAARTAGDLHEELKAEMNIIGYCESMGRFEEGLARSEGAIRRAREAGLVGAELDIRASLVTLLNSAGHFERVVAETDALLLEPVPRRIRSEVSGYCALALIDLGRFEDARGLIDAELARSIDDIGGRFDLLWAQADLALATGDHARAAEIARHCSDRFDGADYPDLLFVRLIGQWAALALGRDPGPPIDLAGRRLDLWSGVGPESAALRRWADGDLAGGAVLFRDAAEMYARFHRRSEMRCRWAEGEALRLAGERGAALGALGVAEARAAELSMLPLLGRIHRSLRLLGERRAAARRTSPSSRGLTAREREVLELVALGLTNREIAARLAIGRPTVARILSNASLKLGTTSRHQTALAAMDAV